MGEDENRKLTAHEAAAQLGYHVNHVYRLLAQNQMKGLQFNRVWMIDQCEVDRIKGLQEDGRLPRSDRA